MIKKYTKYLMALALGMICLFGNIGIVEAQEIQEAPQETLSYVYIEQPQIYGEDVQNIVVSFCDAAEDISAPILTIRDEEGNIQQIEAAKNLGQLLLFSLSHKNETHIYTLDSISYQIGDVYKEITFSDLEMGSLDYAVNEYIDEYENQIIALDVEGISEEGMEVAKAFKSAASEGINEEFSILSERKNALHNFVVVLDPGHDDTHKGASGNGCKEEVLTLQIAKYCKAELEEYDGVTVYMTRETGACPNGGTSTEDNRARVEYAASVNADIYVSIHLNTSISKSAAGAEVYYPNDNYVPWIGSEGADLAWKIQDELAKLGLKDRGAKIRNSADGTRYPDGSLADYYGVIKRSKELGFPGVIVEHAFLSNSSDVQNFLSSEEKIKQLGIADATGIAAYLGVTKEVKPLFSDMPETSGWRYEAVKYVVQKGIMNGISGTDTFAPDAPMSRAMFATVLYRMAGSPDVTMVNPFPDVPEGNYFTKPIIWGNSQGIIKGHSNTGLFGTYDNISREDIVTLMYRYAVYCGYDVSQMAELDNFPDQNEISGYALQPVKWAVASGIVNGRSNTGMLDPKGNASRIECAAILQRFLKNYTGQ